MLERLNEQESFVVHQLERADSGFVGHRAKTALEVFRGDTAFAREVVGILVPAKGLEPLTP